MIMNKEILKKENKIKKNKKSGRRLKALPIQNTGWICREKNKQMMRVFCINPNRIEPDSCEKIEHLKKQIKNK